MPQLQAQQSAPDTAGVLPQYAAPLMANIDVAKFRRQGQAFCDRVGKRNDLFQKADSPLLLQRQALAKRGRVVLKQLPDLFVQQMVLVVDLELLKCDCLCQQRLPAAAGALDCVPIGQFIQTGLDQVGNGGSVVFFQGQSQLGPFQALCRSCQAAPVPEAGQVGLAGRHGPTHDQHPAEIILFVVGYSLYGRLQGIAGRQMHQQLGFGQQIPSYAFR